MEFVDIVSCRLSGITIGGHTSPHGILHDEHSQLFELLAELLDVETDDAVVDVHIGAVVEDVQRTFDVDFQCSRHMAGLWLFLREQGIVEVFQQRHIFGNGVLKIFAVDGVDAAVNDRFFHRLQAFFASDDKLTKRQHKVGFQCQRIVLLAVIAVDVQWVDVLGAGRADMDDLSVQTLHQRSVFGFRVCDNNIIVCHEERIADLAFCCKAFA